MPVIVDAMGGDHAPDEVVAGALEAAEKHELEVVLVGDQERLGAAADKPRVTIHHASEVIGMDEHPAKALRQKRDSSIAVAAGLAKKLGDAPIVSAGSTGAVLAAALFGWKRLPGVERPCIAGLVPTPSGSAVIADIGANVDSKPSHVVQFGVLCSAYARLVLGVDAPRVGLLNIGEEPTKGSEAAQAAHSALSEALGERFVGNVEPEGVFHGVADVVVTDGFAGNIFLKTSEAISNLFHGTLKRALAKAPDLAAQAGPLLSDLGRFSTDRLEHSGAPLLGAAGTALIVHGSAKRDTITKAIRLADRAAQSGILDHLRTAFAEQKEAAHGA